MGREVYSSSGSIYEGMFKNHEKHGYGRIIYSAEDDRLLYIGEWVHGEKHGKGKMIYKNGAINDGIWDYGTFDDWMISSY